MDLIAGLGLVGVAGLMELNIQRNREFYYKLRSRRVWTPKELFDHTQKFNMDPSDAYRNNPLDINRFDNVPTMGSLNTQSPVYSTINQKIPLVTSTYSMHVKTAGASKYG